MWETRARKRDPKCPLKWMSEATTLVGLQMQETRAHGPRLAVTLDLRAMNYEQIMAYAKDKRTEEVQGRFSPTKSKFEDSPQLFALRTVFFKDLR